MRILLVDPIMTRQSPAGGQFLLLAERLRQEHAITIVSERLDAGSAGHVSWLNPLDYVSKKARCLGKSKTTRRNRMARTLAHLYQSGERFDIVHAGASYAPCLPAADDFGYRVVTFHGAPLDALRATGRDRSISQLPFRVKAEWWYRRLRLYRAAIAERGRSWQRREVWVGVSQGVCEHLRREYGMRKVTYIPNAVTIEDRAISPPNAAERAIVDELAGQFVCVMLAHGNWLWKGAHIAVQAMAKLPQDVTLVLVGGGSTGAVSALIEGHRLRGRVRVTGVLENPFTILARADVFLSLSVYETFGLAPAEAALCAVPVVSTRTHGVADWLAPGENGILVDRNPDAVAAEIIRLRRSPGLRRKLGRNARLTISRQYQSELVASAYVKLYKDLLGGR